jgi:hypothetical protein
MCVVSFVMAYVLGFGKRRGSAHHDQKGGGEDFLHGFDCSIEPDCGWDAWLWETEEAGSRQASEDRE